MPMPTTADTTLRLITADLLVPGSNSPLRVVAVQKLTAGVVQKNSVLLKAGTGADIELDVATATQLRAALKDATDALAPPP